MAARILKAISFRTSTYTPVSGDEQEHDILTSIEKTCSPDQIRPQQRKKPWLLRYYLPQLLWRSAVCALCIWAVIDLSGRLASTFRPNWTRPNWTWTRDGMQFLQHECWCGVTRDEAVANGCQFDELALLWLKPRCIDHDLSREFGRKGPGPNGSWYYYLDMNATDTEPLSIEDVSMLPDLFTHVYMSAEEHLLHCFYYWRKLFRQPLTGVIMEPGALYESHIIHCGHAFLRPQRNLSAFDQVSQIAPPRGTIDIYGMNADDLGRFKRIGS